MKSSRKYVAIFSILVILACKSSSIAVPFKNSSIDTLIDSQPPVYICFDTSVRRQKGIHYLQLGDSLFKVIKILGLSITDIDSSLTFGSERIIERHGEFGRTRIYLEAHFYKQKRMDSFQTIWNYKGDHSNRGRAELFRVLQDYAFGCLWEESINLYKPRDTLVLASLGGVRVQFITDLNKENWVVRYEAFWH